MKRLQLTAHIVAHRYFRLAESSLYVSGFRNSQFMAWPGRLACLPSQRHGRFARHHRHFIFYCHASASAAAVATATAAASWTVAAGNTYSLSFHHRNQRNFRLFRRRGIRSRRVVSIRLHSVISWILFMHCDRFARFRFAWDSSLVVMFIRAD